jgi:uncharacterized protein (UPF0335 family)
MDNPRAVEGDNSKGGIASGQLRSYVERIERLEEEKVGIAQDIRDVFTEAKGSGFDTKVMRMAMRLRKMDPAERAEMESILDVYLHALEMKNDES